MNNQNYQTAYKEFSLTFKKMREKLIEWALSKGGKLDTEGYMIGLTANDETHFKIRNEQLESIATYAHEADSLIVSLENAVQRLKTKVRLLETANRETLLQDKEIQDKIDFILDYKIDEDTTLKDFEDVLSDTKFYFELGIKRKMIEPDNAHVSQKLKWAKIFLLDTARMKRFFNNKKAELYDTHESIGKIIKTAAHD